MQTVQLAYDPEGVDKPLLEEIRDALDNRAIPYGSVFVDGYSRPRVQVSGGELEGYDIIDRIDEVEAFISS